MMKKIFSNYHDYIGFLLLLALMFTPFLLYSQQKLPTVRFRSPLGFPLYLSGTFGELRPGHFHSGIDIKTFGVTGKKVYAVANGYVSRIKVSLDGYGNALYVTHPNGYISVYAHLKRFNKRLRQFVRNIQYKRESFTVEIFPAKGKLPIKSGEVIAYSGNSGGSDAPHLHFEIREAKTGFPVNPLLFRGINVSDHQSPKIYRLAVYSEYATSCENGEPDTLIYHISGAGRHYYIKGSPIIKVYGRFSFGLQTNDGMDKIYNRDGVYSIRLYKGSKLVYGLRMRKISFYTTRYVNSLIDYNYYQKNDIRLIRTQVDSNNRVPNYFFVKNRGVFDLKDTLVHHFKYVVADIYRNTSVFQFKVQAHPKKNCKSKGKVKKRQWPGISVLFNRATKIDSGNIRLYFPAYSFYHSMIFHLKKYPERDTTLSPVFAVDDRFVPVQRYFNISIKPTTLADKIYSKLFIAFFPDYKSKGFSYVGGNFSKGWLQAKAREFGCYTVMADTVPPIIKALNFSNNRNLKGQKTLRVMINDLQSGIKDYRPTLNGHWILMEYLPKKKQLVYYFDKFLKKGKNNFQLIVYDNVGNKSVFKATLYY